ncbi:ATP-dependent DNA helicase PIF1-like [Polyergus mexicanus]|uniref:ATP-dependent DNA helicase PIF1-like n=1 Tax=Polyergus mexicanus TaxID=615972 RepID=UPI0038B6B147
MLNCISSDKIEFVAQDLAECAPYLKKKVMKILNKDEDSSRTAGLARIITVKLGARIMVRRNIDVSLGLVNGTIGTNTSIIRSAIDNEVEKIKIIVSSGIEHIIERLNVKFQVMDRAFVIRKQFSICLSYGMAIHKSQGLSLKHAVVEVGNSIFSCGQVYVALSRVTTLDCTL